MVKNGVGLAVALDKLLNVTAHSDLVFRPLEPRLESGLDIVWKKYQIFSSAAELFLTRMRKQILSPPSVFSVLKTAGTVPSLQLSPAWGCWYRGRFGDFLFNISFGCFPRLNAG